MKNYLAISLCLLSLAIVFQISSSQQFIVEPAIFSAISQKKPDALNFCFGYFPHFYKLPHDFQKSNTHHLEFVDRTVLCRKRLFKETVIKNVTNKIVITDNGQCGNLEIVYTVQNLGAWGVLIVNNSTLTNSVASVNVTPDDIHIFIGIISQTYSKEIFNKGVSLMKLRSESNSIFTPVLMVMIAISAVMIGSYFGGKERFEAYKNIIAIQEEMNKADSEPENRNHENCTRIVGADENSDSKNVDMELNLAKKNDEKSVVSANMFEAVWRNRTTNVTKTFAIALVLIACTLLLLLYFFYSYLASVFLVLYLILLTSTTISVLQNLIGIIPHLKYSFSFKCFKEFKLSINTIIASAIAISLSIWWYITRHERFSWVYQDIMGFCFIVTASKGIRMSSLKIITFILVLFFFYDIFFVFITPLFIKSPPVYFFQTGESIMVKVAMGDGSEMLPIALKVPLFNSLSISLCEQYSMLGFGDMLAPGLVICYCHGFDLENKLKKFYYILTSIFYAFGLVIAVIASKLMNSGQPALLYIVPSVIIPVIIASYCRKEFKDIWHGMPQPKLLFAEEKEKVVGQENLSDADGSQSLLNTENQPNNNM